MAKIFQGLGPKRRESSNRDRVYYYYNSINNSYYINSSNDSYSIDSSDNRYSISSIPPGSKKKKKYSSRFRLVRRFEDAERGVSVLLLLCIYIYIYVYIYVCTHISLSLYIYI